MLFLYMSLYVNGRFITVFQKVATWPHPELHDSNAHNHSLFIYGIF